MCLSWNPSASHRTYSITVSNFVLAVIQLHLIENFLRQFQFESELKLNCIPSKIYYDNSILSLSRNSIASCRELPKTIPNCVSAETHLHLIEKILRHFHIESQSKFNCLSSKLFEDKSIFRLSWISTSSHRSCSKTIPNCVLAENQLHLIKIFLKQFHNMFEPKFNCIPSKKFYDSSILRPSRNSYASDRVYSTTNLKCVFVEIQVHLIETTVWQFWIVS